MLLALYTACSCDPLDAPQLLTIEHRAVQQVGGRFRDQPDLPLEPRVAFDVQGRCPVLERVEVRQVNPTIRDVTVFGSNLKGVRRIGALLPDGALASVHFEARDGGLYFPVACERCEVYFGIGAPAADTLGATDVPPLAAMNPPPPADPVLAPVGPAPASATPAPPPPAAPTAAPTAAPVVALAPGVKRSASIAACLGPGYSLSFVDGKVTP